MSHSGYKEIETQEELRTVLYNATHIEKLAFQNLDFDEFESVASQIHFYDCIFLGCAIPLAIEINLKECMVFPSFDLPYNSFISKLYTKDTLYKEYVVGKPETYEDTHDRIVYNHYIKNGKEAWDIKETLARRLHDHAITDALYDFLEHYEEKKVVAIMGGHGLGRDEEGYATVAKISKELTKRGYLMVSGGGPGAMEATHVGAWFADKDDEDLLTAIDILKEAPTYKHPLWLDNAFKVLEKYPNSDYVSLGIPTWLYGHEPPTPFATHIAKYFANSVREDGLLTVAKGGVIYSPGSAGTIQEIFQDATQNHYLSFEFASPMVFMGKDYWQNQYPVYPLLKGLADSGKYKNMILSIYDDVESIVNEIEKFE